MKSQSFWEVNRRDAVNGITLHAQLVVSVELDVLTFLAVVLYLSNFASHIRDKGRYDVTRENACRSSDELG